MVESPSRPNRAGGEHEKTRLGRTTWPRGLRDANEHRRGQRRIARRKYWKGNSRMRKDGDSTSLNLDKKDESRDINQAYRHTVRRH